MKKIPYILVTFVLLGALIIPGTTFADSTSKARIAARIAAMKAELLNLQAELAQEQASTYYSAYSGSNYRNCYPAQGGYYCEVATPDTNYYPYTSYQNYDGVDSISAHFIDGVADVVVHYNRGGSNTYSVNARTQEEVIQYVMDQTRLSDTTVRGLITFTGTSGTTHRHNYHYGYNTSNTSDIRSISVTVNRNNNRAEARVYYSNGVNDTFTYKTDVKNDIISDLANDLNTSESNVRDVIMWTYDDFSSNYNGNYNNNLDNVRLITIDIPSSNGDVAYARVEYTNGHVVNYTYYTAVRNEIISDLANDIGVNTSDLRSFITWN